MVKNLMSCAICKEQTIDVTDEVGPHTFVLDEEGQPKYIVHELCLTNAKKILTDSDKSAEVFALQAKLNDLLLAYQSIQEIASTSVNVKTLIDYLEEFVVLQENALHRSPKGSPNQLALAIRVNDATDVINRIKLLMPKKDKKED